MAVISVQEIWSGRAGSTDQKFVRNYKKTFLVLTNNMLTSNVSVRYAAGIPQLYSSYYELDGTTDPIALCNKVSEAQDQDDPYTWRVEAEYSNKTDWPDLGNPDPTQRPSELTWGLVAFQRILTNDVVNGNAVTNSAGEPFDPPIEVDDHRLRLTVKQYVLGFDPVQAMQYTDAINSDQFMGCDPLTVKCAGLTAVRHFENNIFYWERTGVFDFNFDTWMVQVLDAGYRQIDAGGNLVEIRDNKLNPITRPALLNGAGSIQTTNANPTTTAPMNFGVAKNGSAKTVTPASMSLIGVGTLLRIDTGKQSEVVAVTAVTNTTFTATFQLAHTSNPTPITVVPQPVFFSVYAYLPLPFAALGVQ